MNKYLYFGAISFFVAIGMTGSYFISFLLIPNVNLDLLVAYYFIISFATIAFIVLYFIGTEIKPTDKEDEKIAKRANWPL